MKSMCTRSAVPCLEEGSVPWRMLGFGFGFRFGFGFGFGFGLGLGLA